VILFPNGLKAKCEISHKKIGITGYEFTEANAISTPVERMALGGGNRRSMVRCTGAG
jgi:hypothetical protein